jgi:ParB family chromosome partitioning protein
MKRRALGRGLGALIPGAGDEDAAQVTQVAVSALRPNPMQPRMHFRDETIAELAESIRQKGILQPLLVRRVGEVFELIAGERRLRAAERAGLKRVPVAIKDVSDEEMLELALVENIQREDLNPIEEARAYKAMMTELELTQHELSLRVGKDRSTIANTVRLLQLPEKIRRDIESGLISAGHARALVAAGTDSAKLELAKRIVSQHLSVRETERIAKAKAARTAPPGGDIADAERRLTEALGTRVRLQWQKGNKGKIEIECYSLEQLNGLIDRLVAA